MLWISLGSVLQHVAVCCSVLQCVAVCYSVLQCAAVCCSVLQCVAVCCSVLQCVAVCCSVMRISLGVHLLTHPYMACLSHCRHVQNIYSALFVDM